MIVIFSRSGGDLTTDEVMAWVNYLGEEVYRLNVEDYEGPNSFFKLLLDDSGKSFDIQRLDDPPLAVADISVIWLRRGHNLQSIRDRLKEIHGKDFFYDLMLFLSQEIRATNRLIQYFAGEHTHWIDKLEHSNPSKIYQLQCASSVGFHIPSTIITNNKKDVITFQQKHGKIITKPVVDSTFLFPDSNKGGYGLYTALVEMETVDHLPETFFPCLFQSCVEKDVELRIFYLMGEAYTMAIFSQSNVETQVDFRYYSGKQNRWVPFNLPKAILERIQKLMELLNLTTGSLDVVKATNGDYVFLEVNPSGQFGMVSIPCNYHLEKKLAQKLISYERKRKEAIK
ncbi:grasp-with-spasm system ATP-grasp peptide maturase [Chitinophaga polysaccharea]|uniref:grasp-with-spasm system ATP-grasp peptide maturase n=1 Tax=Chitinophaga polysaccharea TaxID=1293035 RepID=UPI0011590340|nr:grasp-with-spasm system ATP-grasp peptide maturase [Chitinophaga polysaccharea]